MNNWQRDKSILSASRLYVERSRWSDFSDEAVAIQKSWVISFQLTVMSSIRSSAAVQVCRFQDQSRHSIGSSFPLVFGLIFVESALLAFFSFFPSAQLLLLLASRERNPLWEIDTAFSVEHSASTASQEHSSNSKPHGLLTRSSPKSHSISSRCPLKSQTSAH